jgi:hypothetical protein
MQYRMYNEGFQPWYTDRGRFNLRSTSSRELAAAEEGLATINTMVNAKFKFLWTSALTYCKYNLRMIANVYI